MILKKRTTLIRTFYFLNNLKIPLYRPVDLHLDWLPGENFFIQRYQISTRIHVNRRTKRTNKNTYIKRTYTNLNEGADDFLIVFSKNIREMRKESFYHNMKSSALIPMYYGLKITPFCCLIFCL